MEYSSYANNILSGKNQLESRPQISMEVSKELNNLNNVDYYNLNRMYVKDKKKDKNELTKLSLEELYDNLINTLINFSRDFNYEYYNIELESKDKEYSYIYIIFSAFYNYLNKGNNIFYIGLFIVIITSILYFFMGNI